MRKTLAKIGVITALVAGSLFYSNASASAFSPVDIVYTYENQAYNQPCLSYAGCWRVALQWDRGNCAYNNAPGYTWVNGNGLLYSEFDSSTAWGMSSVKLAPYSGCNYIAVQSMQDYWYGQCVNNTGGGINWFGNGYNDNIKAVRAIYFSSCGGHL